jgi:hypothetical protein
MSSPTSPPFEGSRSPTARNGRRRWRPTIVCSILHGPVSRGGHRPRRPVFAGPLQAGRADRAETRARPRRARTLKVPWSPSSAPLDAMRACWSSNLAAVRKADLPIRRNWPCGESCFVAKFARR